MKLENFLDFRCGHQFRRSRLSSPRISLHVARLDMDSLEWNNCIRDSRCTERLQGRRMGPVERMQSQLRGGRDTKDAESHDKAASGWRTMSAIEGDQMVR